MIPFALAVKAVFVALRKSRIAALARLPEGDKVTKTAVCVCWVLIGKLKDWVTLPPFYLMRQGNSKTC